MTEKLALVHRNRLEDIWVSLSEIRGEPHVELRVYGRPTSGNANPLPTREAVTLPVGLLPDLLRALAHAQDLLLKRGLIYIPSPSAGTVQEDGESKAVSLTGPPGTQPSRRDPRVALSLAVECRLVGPSGPGSERSIVGEMRDVSISGAQVWLPKPLPRFAQVEASAVIEGTPFRARAEIVGVELESKRDPKTGYCRHNFRWVALDANAKAALSKVLPREK